MRAAILTAYGQTPEIGEFDVAVLASVLLHCQCPTKIISQCAKCCRSFDKTGPAINAIVEINKNALAEAEALDRRASQGALSGPLHCIPSIVKDNFETIGLQSAAGSLSLHTVNERNGQRSVFCVSGR